MKKSLSVLFLAAGVVVGYALKPAPVVAQADFQPFTLGAKVVLKIEGFPASLSCTVSLVSNEFIHCGREGDRGPRAINLRYVQQITPAPER